MMNYNQLSLMLLMQLFCAPQITPTEDGNFVSVLIAPRTIGSPASLPISQASLFPRDTQYLN